MSLRTRSIIRVLSIQMFLASSILAAKIVMIRNPWAEDSVLSKGIPQIFGAANNWNGDPVAANGFHPVSGEWWSYTFASSTPGDFDLLNRTGGVWKEYKSGGLDASGNTSGTNFNLDALFATVDTVWIAPTPAPAGPAQILTSSPLPRPARHLMVFNPWDGAFPMSRPVVFVDTAKTGTPMTPSANRCGWYEISVPQPQRIVLRSSGDGTAFGAAGLGSTAPITLDPLEDTQWVSIRSGLPIVTDSFPGVEGTCSQALLATKVYDFPLNAPGFNDLYTGILHGLVRDTLDADRKPVRNIDTGRNATIASWFRDVPNLNASTCRDLILSLDTASGLYRMDSPLFFPVDDFMTLPGGSQNPYNDLNNGTTFRHNFSFCLESHGEFEYMPRQKLQFTGDDDLWYFIDGKLRVDLGGVHVSASDSVDLDTLGLVAGRTYPWDFFFCERMPGGSSLRITTSMNLRTALRYSFQDTVAAGRSMLQVWSTTTQGQGCQARTVRASAPGQVLLKGGSMASWKLLGPGVANGGIRVYDSSWQVSLDTSKLQGLDPGTYTLRLRSLRDTTQYREISFTVAAPAPPPAHKLLAGSRCDLISGDLSDTTQCLDIRDLDGRTLRVPAATTRISTKGFVLCGSKDKSVPGTDIVYVVDQSGSMLTEAILPRDRDTLGFYQCPYANGPTVLFHGQYVSTINTTSDSLDALAECHQSGDIYNVRGKVVRDAISQQAILSPNSQAAWISFGGLLKTIEYHGSDMVDLSDSLARTTLLAEVDAEYLGGTNYKAPLGWARVLLQGGQEVTGTIPARPASRNQRKAIIMISDGEPNDSLVYLDALGKRFVVNDSTTNELWTVDSDTTPPIYGIFLSESKRPGRALEILANLTHGEFFQIPPSRPDSLEHVISRILGSIVAKAKPDSLRITNRTNGQISVGTSSQSEGGGFRVRLDSLVGLAPGANQLELRSVMASGTRDSVVTAKWTVVVSDSGTDFKPDGKDSVFMAACSAPSRLSLKPDRDTTRAFADERDSLLRYSLDVAFDGQSRFPFGYSTRFSNDSGSRTGSLATALTGPRATVAGKLTWRMSPGSANRKDTLVQTGFGWDTVYATYRTPRDPRDSATARLPVRHQWPVTLRLSPDSITGGSGRIDVFVHDSNTVADSIQVKICHRLGDTVVATLRRASGSTYQGSFPFKQASVVVKRDTILQTGPLRANLLDSVIAIHPSGVRDTAILLPPPPRLRFVDIAGHPSDTLPTSVLDIGESTTIRFGLYLLDQPIDQDDSALVFLPNWLGPDSGKTSVRIVHGKGSLRIKGLRPGTDGAVELGRPWVSDTLTGSPISVLPFRVRFVDGSGNATDTASIDRDVLSSQIVRVQIWGRAGLCATCSGDASVAGDSSTMRILDTNATYSDTIRIRDGRGAFVVRGIRPATDAALAISAPTLFAQATVTPVVFRAYRLLFVDSSGALSDRWSVDRLVRTRETIRLRLFGKDGACTSCSGRLGMVASDSGLVVTDSVGNAASFLLNRGEVVLTLKSDGPVEGASLNLSFDSLFASASVAPVRFLAPPPDSAVYEDRDGDGALDRARVFFRIPWNPSNRMLLPWPDTGTFLDPSKAEVSLSDDSLVADFDFTAPQSPGRTAWTRRTPVQASWAWNSSFPTQPFSVIERIAPIPTGASIHRGRTHDTLIVAASELLDATSASRAPDLVRLLAPGLPRIPSNDKSWSIDDRNIRLAFPSDSIDAIVRPGDSARLSPHGDARDTAGSAPSDIAPSVVVAGIDRGPYDAAVLDIDADGRADRIVLRFKTAPRVAERFRFGWSDPTGTIAVRDMDIALAKTDSAGRILAFSPAPFAFGATSCPAIGCADLGSMQTNRFGDTIGLSFDERDAVVPVIVRAQLRFGKAIGVPDTLRARISEPVQATPGAEWLRWGKPSFDSLGGSAARLSSRAPAPDLLELLVDSSFLATAQDSLRIGAWPDGGVQDLDKNRPERFAHWTALELGPIPVRVDAIPWHPMVAFSGWTLPPGEPALSVFVHAKPGEPWKTLDGDAPAQDTSHYAGILIKANSDLDEGVLYMYDNMGTSVASVDLSAALRSMRGDAIGKTIRGGYETWVAWNGRTSSGSIAPSGVYIGRLLVWKRSDQKLSLTHRVFRMGWHAPLPATWDKYDHPIW